MKTNEANKDIRERLTMNGYFLWQLAKKIGIAPTTLTVWMRDEIPADDPRRTRIETAINQLEDGKKC